MTEEDIQGLEAINAQATKNLMPCIITQDGTIYALGGSWSTDKREYKYQHLEVAGEDAYRCRDTSLVTQVASWAGADCAGVYNAEDPDWDGQRLGLSHPSLITLYRIPTGVPARITFGFMYHSSLGAPSGRKHVYYYNCKPDTFIGYRRAIAARGPKAKAS